MTSLSCVFGGCARHCTAEQLRLNRDCAFHNERQRVASEKKQRDAALLYAAVVAVNNKTRKREFKFDHPEKVGMGLITELGYPQVIIGLY